MIIELIEKTLRAQLEYPKSKLENLIVLASFPKSGNTWLRFVTSNILSMRTDNEEINFHTIENYAPEIRGNQKLIGIKTSESVPTFLKTHFYYGKKFNKFKSIVLYRDPSKTLSSYFSYMNNEHEKNIESLYQFINKPRYGIDAWNLFHKSWLNSSAYFFKYEDVIKKPELYIKKIYSLHGAEIEDFEIKQALYRSSREEMRKLEISVGDPNKKNKRFEFVGDPLRNSEILTNEITKKIKERTDDTIKELDKRRITL